MYTHFFGFKERPFKLVPNPDYLYLSQSHEEALAHLTYAVSEGDGFLAITGEVGTGKTTLCRSFMEKLDNTTVVAYIFNPKLDALQLLKAINDEFEIPSDFDSTKDLIDTLNGFLIAKKKEGKKVVLLIDEAQNLTADVLEQLRLLSNLETTREKLLQIILVGQPELYELLDSRELRQLAQRITLRRHLLPLNTREVKEYVAHRIHMASQKSQVKFSGSAIRAINTYSNGIPRLINIVCDRSLLTAYGLNQKRITRRIVREAVRELNTRGNPSLPNVFEAYKIPILLSLLLTAILLGVFHPDDIFTLRAWLSKNKTEFMAVVPPANSLESQDIPSGLHPVFTGQAPAPLAGHGPSQISPDMTIVSPGIPVEQPVLTKNPEIPAVDAQSAMAVQLPGNSPNPPSPPKPESFHAYLQTVDIAASRENAAKAVLDLWGVADDISPLMDEIMDDATFFLFEARQNGLSLHTVKNNFSLAKRLNLPFILEIYWPEKMAQVYLAVCRVEDDAVHLKSGPHDPGFAVAPDTLGFYMGETAYVFWKNFYGYTGIIPTKTSTNHIVTLKLHIREMGFSGVDITPYYDPKTRNIVKTVQEKYNIAVDGLVGPLTTIALYNETPSLPIPRIFKQGKP